MHDGDAFYVAKFPVATRAGLLLLAQTALQ